MTNLSGTWVPVDAEPDESDIIRWNEPIWAAPNKPRGKPDQIGEQRVTAKILRKGEVYELNVIEVVNMDPASDVPLKTKDGDSIRRKEASIAKGVCHRLVKE